MLTACKRFIIFKMIILKENEDKKEGSVLTKTGPKGRNIYSGKRFSMTLHGQRKTDLRKLKNFFDGKFRYPEVANEMPRSVPEVIKAVVSKEFGKNKIHPHWQVYFELSDMWRMKGHMTEILGHNDFHLERTIGTEAQNVRYVFGIEKPYEIGWIVYQKNILVPWDYDPSACKFWKNFKLLEWQSQLVPLLIKKDVDRREIIYIFDQHGNTGKTILSEYLHIFHSAIITGGKDADMKHAIARWQEITSKCPTIIIVDIARSSTSPEYSGIESIKNGLFFSGKYESAMLHSVKKANIVVFSNFPPQTKNLSEDRWKIGEIVDNKIIWQ